MLSKVIIPIVNYLVNRATIREEILALNFSREGYLEVHQKLVLLLVYPAWKRKLVSRVNGLPMRREDLESLRGWLMFMSRDEELIRGTLGNSTRLLVLFNIQHMLNHPEFDRVLWDRMQLEHLDLRT
ncbi:hypothetical protein ROCKET24_131 [Vibrio phage Rocket24]|uniref:Uncharacterized protein n=1 Tax=Vibrio phage Chester TaxID=2712961 RepID=A0A6G8R564_9CAUD|nr:hypothetical protein KNU88_gp173 [Vibrio phage Chester]QIG66234.1 hypothetical protein CILSICK_134 [Vibrio phage Cilsick]QIN96540.1 hypothetical protein CHESTER_136 [Vibrio phage Chester]WBU77116.1 hypothetical protein NOELLE_131 [Vibrio phage Noelle]WCD55805.1 hypothetical protein ROCKET24_131 [Vibrio phage Rocket24]